MEPNWEFSAPQFRDFTAMGSEASEDSDDFFRYKMAKVKHRVREVHFVNIDSQSDVVSIDNLIQGGYGDWQGVEGSGGGAGGAGSGI